MARAQHKQERRRTLRATPRQESPKARLWATPRQERSCRPADGPSLEHRNTAGHPQTNMVAASHTAGQALPPQTLHRIEIQRDKKVVLTCMHLSFNTHVTAHATLPTTHVLRPDKGITHQRASTASLLQEVKGLRERSFPNRGPSINLNLFSKSPPINQLQISSHDRQFPQREKEAKLAKTQDYVRRRPRGLLRGTQPTRCQTRSGSPSFKGIRWRIDKRR